MRKKRAAAKGFTRALKEYSALPRMNRRLSAAKRMRLRRTAAALTEFCEGNLECKIGGDTILTAWCEGGVGQWRPGEKYIFAWEAKSGLCITVEMKIVFPQKRGRRG